jgi:hypothetical protein
MLVLWIHHHLYGKLTYEINWQPKFNFSVKDQDNIPLAFQSATLYLYNVYVSSTTIFLFTISVINYRSSYKRTWIQTVMSFVWGVDWCQKSVDVCGLSPTLWNYCYPHRKASYSTKVLFNYAWTLSEVNFSKHRVLEVGFRLRLQVWPNW